MNKDTLHYALAAVIVLSSNACSSSSDSDTAPEVTPKEFVQIGVTTPASSRVIYNSVVEDDNQYDVVKVVNGITIDWTQGDQLGFYSDALSYGTSTGSQPANLLLTAPADPEATLNIIHTESSNNFYEFKPASELFWKGTDGANNMFYAYRNYSSSQGSSPAAVIHTLPASQETQLNNFQYINDKGYDFAYAKTVLTSKPADKVVPLNFVHPYTVLLIRFGNLTNGTNIRTVTGLSVTTSGDNLAGTNTFDLTSSTIDTRNIGGTAGNEDKIISPTVTDGSKTITLTSIAPASRAPIIDDGTNTPAGLESEAQYAVIVLNPAGTKNGNTLTFTFNGKQTVGDDTYTKTVSMTLTADLLAGKVYRLRINAN